MTGAPLLIHPGRDETAPLEIIDILDRAGADLSHTIMGHLDRTVFERGTLKQIAESGCYMEWDLFGWVGSYYSKNLNIDMPSDDQRLERIAWISSEGYGSQSRRGAGHMHEAPSGEVRRPRLLIHTGPHSSQDAVQGLHS